jgi:hypothetical protein
MDGDHHGKDDPKQAGESVELLQRFTSSSHAVEKGSYASLRSIASLQRSDKYATAHRFLARLASETFLNSLYQNFSSACTASITVPQPTLLQVAF